ncbi:MAG: acyl-CoA dehydrogenase [Deltaproteobacteria bacterium HGW-Deltaproteobacteria-6]|jgi:alkylation response protein AidB-like acyl-CoA dehydrogenase|nr:MAG: acyl-CoA dehydrogenase [Deltaproteobacteria bacterium HGW-Deltaproteobacteria-6]
MDYRLSDELQMLKDMAYKFGQAEMVPIAHEADEKEAYTPEVRMKAAENGLLGAWIPEEYGGPGVGFLGHTIITEELSKACIGIGLNLYGACFGAQNVYHYGTEEQKQQYLPPICTGEYVFAGAYTEPNAGTDVAGYKTRAVRDGKDWVINGTKMFITNGTCSTHMIVQAITEPDAKKHSSFSQILVPCDTKGVTRTKLHGKLGLRASDTAEIALEDVRVPLANLVGTPGKGFYQLMHFFDVTRIMIAAQALGLSEACLAASVKYAKERMVFGAPLGSYQITMQKLTEMAIKIEALRGFIYKSAWLVDNGTPDYTLAAMGKYLGGQTAVYCANAGVEIHGGYGYMEEYDVQKWYRDAKILELYEGTKEAEIMTIGKLLQK